jgi:hypothetical protein
MKPESQPQLNLTVTGSDITIRHGEALPAKADKSIIINGTLAAPAHFLDGKLPEAITSNIQIAKDKGCN